MPGLFRCFTRRKSTTTRRRQKNGKVSKDDSSRTRSNSPPHDTDEDSLKGLENAMRTPVVVTSNGKRRGSKRAMLSNLPVSPDQLSRITEEPTDLTLTTKGRPQTVISPNQLEPPAARDAAFFGPTRFDWMDVEAHAAVKIQSIARRNIVMNKLEAQGISTSAIRNRKRRRKAKKLTAQSADVPSVFACCAVGLAFGDATEQDDQAYREFQRKQYNTRVEQQQMHETALRKRYLKSHGTAGNVMEQIEVIE
eukprot:Nitzschia sp. Nitz4//scaffold120_size68122//44587//45448//NITZ4_006050-RA/size68122-augustus-gene-0.58-mRNA-1//1//CDS//3329534296//949//frame0